MYFLTEKEIKNEEKNFEKFQKAESGFWEKI